MPRATVSSVPERFDLKSAPPDGYVLVRRMSFGQFLHSQDLAFQVSMQESRENAGQAEMGAKVSTTAVAEFQLATCVVDHNLEDENGNKLNFGSPGVVQALDPLIGQELQIIIARMHNPDVSHPNSASPSTNGSSVEGAKMLEDAISTEPSDPSQTPS